MPGSRQNPWPGQRESYAGCAIVCDSGPAAELAESEVKLGALLPALAGYPNAI